MRGAPSIVVAVALLVALAACAEDEPAPAGATGTTTPTGPTATVTETPSESPVSESPPPETGDELEDGRNFGYVTSVDVADATIEFDLALFYTGDEANEVAGERGDETPVPNDYYIVNDNPKLRTVPLSPDLEITLIDWNRCCDETFSPTLEDFAAAIASDDPVTIDGRLTYGRSSQYWLTVQDGSVVAIEEQYLP
jgi:hypothetical protein